MNITYVEEKAWLECRDEGIVVQDEDREVNRAKNMAFILIAVGSHW